VSLLDCDVCVYIIHIYVYVCACVCVLCIKRSPRALPCTGWNKGPRLAQPICWEPRSRRSEAALLRKALLCCQGLPSTHWASLGVQHSMSLEEALLTSKLAVREAVTDKEENGESNWR
jgi:hypothetical protein